MIAGTYTPFTTCRLQRCLGDRDDRGGLDGAVAGAATKLLFPGRFERGSVVAYLSLRLGDPGGMRPMLGSVDVRTAILIGVGGVLYSIGVGFHVWRALPLPEGYLAQLRAGRGQLPLRSYSAWRGVCPIVSVIATI